MVGVIRSSAHQRRIRHDVERPGTRGADAGKRRLKIPRVSHLDQLGGDVESPRAGRALGSERRHTWEVRVDEHDHPGNVRRGLLQELPELAGVSKPRASMYVVA